MRMKIADMYYYMPDNVLFVHVLIHPQQTTLGSG